MATSSEKLDLQGMLWYHGSKSQKEAETSLESCTRDSSSCCYVVREHKGSLYLSLYYKEMHYHLPITSAQHGYVLEDHYNPFRTLKELVSHHQKHSVYVEGGEFTLSICCHKDFSALAVKFINDFSGPCTLQVREDSIAVKRSNGKEIGRWPYAFIREFRFDDERIQFSFMSGRRGIFGVADYLFKLHNRTYFNLRETVNRIASGRSSSGKSKPSDSKPPVPPHSRKSSTHKMQNAADMYDGLPVLRSLGHQRSTSNPNLAQELIEHLKPRSSFGDSTKSDPSQHGPPNCNMSHRGSTGGFLSQSNSPILDRVFRPHSPQPWSRTNLDSKDYQVPRPATESDYNVPRPLFDPRNDYQIPKPMDETYMVPRPVHEMRSQGRSDSSLLMLSALRETRETSKGLEHSYEDLDKAAVEKH